MNYKEMIDNKGIKHVYIAKQIGVSKAFLSMCLNGKRQLPKEREEQLKKVLLSN